MNKNNLLLSQRFSFNNVNSENLKNTNLAIIHKI